MNEYIRNFFLLFRLFMNINDTDTMDMYYPDTDEDQPSLQQLTPLPPDFITSWCRNGHGMRIDPKAIVYYIVVNRGSQQHLGNIIVRNGHGHPRIRKGVVEEIVHAEESVKIKPCGGDDGIEVEDVTVPWDLVIAREEDSSRHSSLPLALKGTNDPDEDTFPTASSERGWMLRRTLEFKSLRSLMPAMKEQYIDDRLCIGPVRRATLAAVAKQTLLAKVSGRVVEERISFVAALEDEMAIDVE